MTKSYYKKMQDLSNENKIHIFHFLINTNVHQILSQYHKHILQINKEVELVCTHNEIHEKMLKTAKINSKKFYLHISLSTLSMTSFSVCPSVCMSMREAILSFKPGTCSRYGRASCCRHVQAWSTRQILEHWEKKKS